MVGNRREFHRELEAIEAKVIEIFAMVAEDLPKATQALLSGDGDVLQVLAEREQVIDALYPEIENLANRAILLQAPVASDLRFLLSVLRITPELERSHDLVMQIANRANHILSEDLSTRSRGIVERMGNLVSSMWRQAADCWYQRDRSTVSSLAERDEEMDELHASLIAELASGQMALPVTMEMTQVAWFYERLGAHAVNIARRVAYLAGPSADSRDEPGAPALGLPHPASDVGLGAGVTGIFEDLPRGAVFDQHARAGIALAVRQHGEEGGAVADPRGLLHVVRDDDDRVPLLELLHQVLNGARRDRVKGRGGLVHEDDVRLDGDRPGDTQPLCLAAGQGQA
jgi:phosphate transport system protein